jgi:hypothetical protein
MQSDDWTSITKLAGAFRDYVNAPKIMSECDLI